MRKRKRIYALAIALALTIAVLTGCADGAETQTTAEQSAQEQGALLPVLMYHSVAADGAVCGEWTVTESTFRSHMQWLTEHGYTSVLPSELVGEEILPDRAVLITFDDGYTDNYTRALPILQETGHKAVISIVTSYMDVREEFMTWDMCRKISASGVVELGSHTHDLHRYPGLSRLEGETREEYEARVFADLMNSIRLFEENLGYTPLLIAYPHGIVDEWAEDYVNQHFRITLFGVGSVNERSDGLLGLERYNINENTDLSKYLPD